LFLGNSNKNAMRGTYGKPLESLSLEAQADHLLAAARKKVPRNHPLWDHLSPQQLEARVAREVYSSLGYPEEAFYSGSFKKADNPELRKRSVKGVSDG